MLVVYKTVRNVLLYLISKNAYIHNKKKNEKKGGNKLCKTKEIENKGGTGKEKTSEPKKPTKLRPKFGF
jgi:hypothetical protein